MADANGEAYLQGNGEFEATASDVGSHDAEAVLAGEGSFEASTETGFDGEATLSGRGNFKAYPEGAVGGVETPTITSFEPDTSKLASGCGEWTVWLADRFGTTLHPIYGVQSISGSPLRIVDNTSDISISINAGTESFDVLCEMRPWAREIQVRLDGTLMWAGPIQTSNYGQGGSINVTAKDLLQWLDARTLSGRIAAGPVAEQFTQIIEQAMEEDDIGLVASAGFVSVNGELRITDISSALSEVIDLAPFLDFTMVGRELLVGGEEVPFRLLPSLILPHHTRNFTLDRLGTEEASQVTMKGGDNYSGGFQQDGGLNAERAVGTYPETLQVDSEIGVVQRRIYDTSILTERVATIAAYSAYRYAQPPLWSLSNVVLDLQRSPYSINDLVAGAIMPVQIPGLDCWRNDSVMRITSVSLDVSVDDDGSVEDSLVLDLQPAGVYTDELGPIARRLGQ